MTIRSLRAWISHNEPLAIVAIAVAITASLFTFEAVTGLPASVRSGETYNALTLPKFRPAVSRTVKKESLRDKRLKQRMRTSSSAQAR